MPLAASGPARLSPCAGNAPPRRSPRAVELGQCPVKPGLPEGCAQLPHTLNQLAALAVDGVLDRPRALAQDADGAC
eukprot:679444-Pyramimonas_sp.AAC.1